MRKSLALVAAAALLTPLAVSFGQRGVQGTGTIVEVAVFDASSGLRLNGATVSVRDLSDRSVRQSATGARGESATLTGISPGRYYVYATRGGYIPGYFGQRGGEGFRAEILVEREVNLRYEIFLSRAGAISGRILDVNRRLLENAEIALMTAQYSPLGERFLAIPTNIPVVRTNRTGSYQFRNVPPGEYYIRAVHTEETQGRRVANHSLRTYYPGTAIPDQAIPIVIPAEGGDRPGNDFSFTTGSVWKITGTIQYPPQPPDMEAPGAPDRFYLVPQETLYAQLVDPAGGLPDLNTARGIFELTNVPRGTYDLFVGSTDDFEVKAPGGTVKLGYTGHAIVNVTDRDVEGVRVYLDPGVELKGQFRMDAAARALKPNLGELQPQFIPVDRKPAVFAPGAGVDFRSFVNPDGTFQLDHAAAGEYRVIVAGSSNLYMKGAWLGPLNILGFPLVLDRRVIDSLVLELGGDGARYEASVLDANYRPVPNARVVLIPQPDLRNDPTAYKTGFTSPEGHFEIHGIRPGNYSAFAFRDIPERAWANESYMTPYRTFGISLSLPGSTLVHQNLNIIEKR